MTDPPRPPVLPLKLAHTVRIGILASQVEPNQPGEIMSQMPAIYVLRILSVTCNFVAESQVRSLMT